MHLISKNEATSAGFRQPAAAVSFRCPRRRVNAERPLEALADQWSLHAEPRYLRARQFDGRGAEDKGRDRASGVFLTRNRDHSELTYPSHDRRVHRRTGVASTCTETVSTPCRLIPTVPGPVQVRSFKPDPTIALWRPLHELWSRYGVAGDLMKALLKSRHARSAIMKDRRRTMSAQVTPDFTPSLLGPLSRRISRNRQNWRRGRDSNPR